MRTLQRVGLVLGLATLAVGLFAVPAVKALNPKEFYTRTSGEISIPEQANGFVEVTSSCRRGDIVVGGGHIVHNSTAPGMTISKSYPSSSDTWKVKVVNDNGLSGKRLEVFAVCADVE